MKFHIIYIHNYTDAKYLYIFSIFMQIQFFLFLISSLYKIYKNT